MKQNPAVFLLTFLRNIKRIFSRIPNALYRSFRHETVKNFNMKKTSIKAKIFLAKSFESTNLRLARFIVIFSIPNSERYLLIIQILLIRYLYSTLLNLRFINAMFRICKIILFKKMLV